MKRQNPILTRLGRLPLLVVPLLLASCLNLILKQPTFVVREITLQPRSLTEMNLRIGIETYNPNRFDLTLTSLDYAVYLDGRKVGAGRLEKECRIAARSATRVEAPLDVRLTELGGGLLSILTDGDAPYRIEGNAEIRTAFGSGTFPFSREGRL